MPVAGVIQAQLERASWIRRMFEEGLRLRAERGEERVYDFTLGNPDVEPPEAVLEVLRRLAAKNRPHSHGYMPNAGFPEVREVIARRLSRDTGLPYTANHIFMTVGSAGAINTFLKAILDPGDEVLVPIPCFSEYRFYVENHRGVMVPVETDDEFSLDIGRIAEAITPRTRAIILNSPHNPTGVMYSAATLARLEDLLRTLDHPVTVISDEPYKPLVFDGAVAPETPSIISQIVVANSWSKSMAIPGERIGYLALSPRLQDLAAIAGACTFTNRILGYINAPAIWQWVVAEAPEVTVDVKGYQEKRDLLCGALCRMGYVAPKPQGTFYVFPRSPIADDVAFVRELQREGILAVPGSGFGRAGYFRLSLTVPRDMIERSLPGFERVMQGQRGAA
jgi:aspartate aminotransferase